MIRAPVRAQRGLVERGRRGQGSQGGNRLEIKFQENLQTMLEEEVKY